MYKVYWNLRKKCFSVKFGTLPVVHKDSFLLGNCRFHIVKSLQQRCRSDHVRNVHAYIIAETLSEELKEIQDKLPFGQVRYNPYRNEHFTTDFDEPIFEAKTLLCYKTEEDKYRILIYE